MDLVKLCLWCGLVNRPTRAICTNCGADLPINAFNQPHLPAGIMVDLGRADPEIWARSVGGGEVVLTPDRRMAVVRRRWTERPPWWRRPPDRPGIVDALLAQDDHIHAPVRYRGPQVLAELLVTAAFIPVAIVIRVIRVLLETLDDAGKIVAQLSGLRGWPVEAVFDRGQPRRLLWLIRGRKRSREAVDNIADALRIGDLEYRSEDRR